MDKIVVGGVPEHFNLPWHLCIEEGVFGQNNLDVVWKDFPGGTGAMCKALRAKEIDIAIILTEGIVKDIIAGNPSKIIQTYIETPLIWGIHVGAKSRYTSLKEIENTKAAISRYGSGSHLMAYVNAQQQGWQTNNLKFEVIGNLNGAVESLTNAESDYFMWEHFTTKPLVDNGTFRRVGDCPTPWPCFVIASNQDFLKANNKNVEKLLDVINNMSKRFKSIENIDQLLAELYEQKLEDIQKWLEITEWSQSQIKKETLDKVQNQLFELNIIQEKVESAHLIMG